VKAILPRLRETLPKSLKLDTVGDQSAFVRKSVNSVVFEGVLAAGLTGLMILIFMGSWRSTVAIMDGARQIVVPATVSLLCNCIVFVPMFSLGGVSGFLFKPLAEAVVFALISSYVLSRTPVNKMARFLLAGQTHPHGETTPTRNPFTLCQRGFERNFERVRGFYIRVLTNAVGGRWMFIGLFLVMVGASFALAPFLGRNFFPSAECTDLKLHVRAPTGTRIEGTAALCDRIEETIRQTLPEGVVTRCAGDRPQRREERSSRRHAVAPHR
jgi:multidrug efflux pump subunit AcrB